VVHAAGVITPAAVADLTDGELDETLGPKTIGAWNLHGALDGEDLDFFVLFSSITSLIGAPLLGAYAAGNSFLDVLAHHRRRAGLPATCVNWGVWASVGMAARLEAEGGRTMLSKGMRACTADEAIGVLDALLGADATQAMVMPIDWARWRQTHPAAAAAPLLRDLLLDVLDPEPAPAGDGSPRSRARTAAGGPLSVRQECADVEAYLTEQVATVTGLPAERLNRWVPLKRQGLDSLMAVEVRNRIQRQLGASLPPTTLLGENAVTDVARELSALLVVDDGQEP
jgi:hypothetical protein